MSPLAAQIHRDATRLKAVLKLAESCEYEEGHSRQVTRLAARLFDELHPLHRLGGQERFLLECAGLLHDIGWVEGRKGHHKAALAIILRAPILPFSTRERFVVGSIARYHRRSLPSEKHDHYASLKPADRALVCALGGMLRVADGLDRTHANVVEDLTCGIDPGDITIHCLTRFPAEVEVETALSKGDLLERAFERKLAVKWHTRANPTA